MNILFVSRSKTGKPHPFVEEQADSLVKNFNVKLEHFLIQKGGLMGYLQAVKDLADYTKKHKIDIIHVHYGLSALAVVLAKFFFGRKYKVISTFHGSDIHKPTELTLSLLAARFSSHNILVSQKMERFFKDNYSLLPCGIDINIDLAFREATRKEYNWGPNDFVVLFSSNFNREAKDPAFAFKVIEKFKQVSTKNVRFIELKGYTRNQLTKLMQAADVLILCSIREGSPQVLKEAILNSLPVISNDVGDIRSILDGVDNCFVIPKEIDEYIKHLDFISRNQVRIKDRSLVIEKFDNDKISNKIYKIYNEVLA